MIYLLSILKTKTLVIGLLLMGYTSTCLIHSTFFNKKQGFSLVRTMVNTSESSTFPFSVPLSTDTGQEPFDNENNFSQEDENFIGFLGISITPTLDSKHIYYLSNPPSPGSLIPPFSPPEIYA